MDDGIQFDNKKLLFAEMSEITLKDGDTPAWTFVYQGEGLEVPYDPSEKEFVEPFIKQAVQKPSIDERNEMDKGKEKEMDRYESQIKGDPIVYTNEWIEFGNRKLPFEEMSEITLQDGDPPVWSFVFRGKRLKVPYSPSEKVFIEPFIIKAMQKQEEPVVEEPVTKKPFYKRTWFLAALAAILLLILIIVGIAIHSGGEDRDYKAACSEITYNEFSQNADQHLGEKLKFSGRVQQVILDNEGGVSEYMVAVTKKDNDSYADSIYLYYDVGDNDRIAEKDIITMYGEASGEYTYTNASGESVTIPILKAEYVDFGED